MNMKNIKTLSKTKEITNTQVRFNIKEVANEVGVVPATIRNWERSGLFTAKRSGNNYRYFDFTDIEYLKRIASYTADGMSISFIKHLMSDDDGPARLMHSSPLPPPGNGDAGDYSNKLHACRLQKGMTLTEVSKQIGISPSYLSRIEQGKCNITLNALQKLSAFYGEAADSFVDPYDPDLPIVRDGKGHLLALDAEDTKVYSLTNMDLPSFNVAKVYVKPGGGLKQAHKHKAGFDVVNVLKGTFCFTIDEKDEYTLNVGDTLTFSAAKLHKWMNISNRDGELIWYHSYM